MKASNVALGKVAKFIRGVTYKPADLVDNFSEDSIVCMRTANIQQELNESDLKSIRSSVVKSEEKYLQEGDILVSTANSWNLVGKCCWVSNLYYLAVPGGFIAALRVDDHLADARYVYHWFNSKKIQELARNCGRQTTNISNMDLNRCLLLELPLPPLPEQRRIAAILDKAEALRAKRREAIAKLDQLLQSVFLEMFGDKDFPELKVEELALERKGSIRTGPFGSQLLHSEFTDQGIKVLGIDNAVKNQFTSGESRYISLEKYESLKRYTVYPGDLIITIMGTCGRCAVVPENIEKSINTKHLCCITLDKKKCNPEYLHSYFLMHPSARNYLGERSKGAIMDGLNMGIIKEMPVACPPIELQEKYCLFKFKIQNQKEKLISFEVEMENLNKSLQQKYFS